MIELDAIGPSEGIPTWFGRPEQPQFGWMHIPDSGTARGIAVLCPPLGRETANALPALQFVASRLAIGGIAALRFDYSGTGDSAGAWDEPDRVATWVADVRRAVDFARERTSGPVVLIGMRMGALLANESVTQGTPVDGLLLWDPCPSGRDFLRREAALLTTAYGAPQAGDGSVIGPAFTYSPETSTDLGQLALVPGPDRPGMSTLVLARPGASATRAARTLFEGASAEWQEVEGLPGLMEAYPDTLVLPAEAMAAVVTWTAERAGDEWLPVSSHSLPTARVHGSSGGTPVSERALRLGPNRLFAMRTEPEGSDGAVLPTVVFLSAGALDHTGPGRQWVELARQFAEAGICSVRVDFDGIGESFGRPGLPRNVPKPAQAIDDLIDMAAALGDPDGSGLVFVGLSSGGYYALEAGLHLHPLGVCAINPGLFAGFPETEHGPIDPRRLAARGIPPRLRSMAVRHARTADALWTAYLQLRVDESPHSAVMDVCRRGTPLLLLLAEKESEQFEPSLYWGIVGRRLRRRGLLEETVIHGKDHSLYTPDGKTRAYPVLTAWVTSRFAGPERGGTPARMAAPPPGPARPAATGQETTRSAGAGQS